MMIVLIGLAINIFWSMRTDVLGASTNLSTSSLLLSTNRERLTHGDDSLKIEDKLSSAAQAKANDMVNKNYWSHTAPSGDEPWEFIKKSGYAYFAAGENLAYGFNSADQIIAGWMNSQEHRANLLNSDYSEVGFGIATAKDFRGHGKTTVVVAMYAQPSMMGDGDFSSIATTSSSDIPMRNVSRVQLMTGGQAPWSYALVALLGLLAAAWFLTRHFKAWKRVLVESEEFIIHHKFLDILIVTAMVAGFVLTRAAGFIH